MGTAGHTTAECPTIEILPILLKNPECRLICTQDRKNPDFDIRSDTSMKNFMISIQEHLTDQEYTLLILMSRKLQNSTKYKMKSSICTQSHANKNKNRNDNRLANTLDQKTALSEH